MYRATRSRRRRWANRARAELLLVPNGRVLVARELRRLHVRLRQRLLAHLLLHVHHLLLPGGVLLAVGRHGGLWQRVRVLPGRPVHVKLRPNELQHLPRGECGARVGLNYEHAKTRLTPFLMVLAGLFVFAGVLLSRRIINGD